MTKCDSLNSDYNGQHQRSILLWPEGNCLYLYSNHMHDKSLKYAVICTERNAAATTRDGVETCLVKANIQIHLEVHIRRIEFKCTLIQL